MNDKSDVPLATELNESGYHVSQIIRCLNKSQDKDAEKTSIDLIAMTRELMRLKTENKQQAAEINRLDIKIASLQTAAPPAYYQHKYWATFVPGLHIVVDGGIELKYYRAEVCFVGNNEEGWFLEVVAYDGQGINDVKAAVWIDVDRIDSMRVNVYPHESRYIWAKPDPAKQLIVKKCCECPFVRMIDPKHWFREEGVLNYLWCRLDISRPTQPRQEWGYTTNASGICRVVKTLNEGAGNKSGWTFDSLLKHLKEIGWIRPMSTLLQEMSVFKQHMDGGRNG